MHDLLPADYSESEYQATCRAVRGLADAGKVRLAYRGRRLMVKHAPDTRC